jgi:hypothetical protein
VLVFYLFLSVLYFPLFHVNSVIFSMFHSWYFFFYLFTTFILLCITSSKLNRWWLTKLPAFLVEFIQLWYIILKTVKRIPYIVYGIEYMLIRCTICTLLVTLPLVFTPFEIVVTGMFINCVSPFVGILSNCALQNSCYFVMKSACFAF